MAADSRTKKGLLLWRPCLNCDPSSRLVWICGLTIRLRLFDRVIFVWIYNQNKKVTFLEDCELWQNLRSPGRQRPSVYW